MKYEMYNFLRKKWKKKLQQIYIRLQKIMLNTEKPKKIFFFFFIWSNFSIEAFTRVPLKEKWNVNIGNCNEEK